MLTSLLRICLRQILAYRWAFCLLLALFCVGATQNAWCSSMMPIALSGWNRDVVVETNASGPPYLASAALEVSPGDGTAYYQSGLPGKAHGLPATGSFLSTGGDGSQFQFQPYTVNNALVLSSETGLTTGTLTFNSPLIYNRIAVLANSAGGGSTTTMTIHFVDGSTFTISYNASNWLNSPSAIALQGVERISLGTGGVTGAPTNPRFYQTTIPLGTYLGSNNRSITSITFSKASGASATAIYAVSGEAIPLIGANITTQPTNTVINEGASAVFAGVAAGFPSPALQWFKNGLPIANATNNAVTNLSTSYLDDGAKFFLVATNLTNGLGVSATSTVATLTVIPDTTPPILLGASSVGLSNVLLSFSKLILPASVTNPANYSVSGPAGTVMVVGAFLDGTQTNVLLQVNSLSDKVVYTVLVNDVSDRAALRNLVPRDSAAQFTASTFAQLEIGNPSPPGTWQLSTNGLIISGAGDLGAVADQFHFAYSFRSGDFDISARLVGLNASDVWAKAGLMARDTLSPSGQFAAVLGTTSIDGNLFAYRTPSNNPSVKSGFFPVNYPNNWLRLSRAGNLFTGYASYDGHTWTVLGAVSIVMPQLLYFGLTVSGHGSVPNATANFSDIQDTTPNAIVGTLLNPHDVMGPSSRRSPLVISEIMYQPAPRLDGRNLEYVELYNSNPWFQDLSGYFLVGDVASYNFPKGTGIAGGSYLVVASSPADVQAVYGITNVSGPYSGTLRKSGLLELHDEQGAALISVPYSNVQPWPMAADGTGHSIVLANPTYGEADARAWDISDVVGGSPGMSETFRPDPLRAVVINELLAHSEHPGIARFIELYNHSALTVDLSGCVITDDFSTNKFKVPDHTGLPPGGYLSFTENQLGFAPAAAGGIVYLVAPDRSRVLDAVQYEAQADGVSLGRLPNGVGPMYPLAARTPGASNADLLLRDVLINELMYDPISGNDDDQYIELYNQGTNAVNLGGWLFTAGINYSFPSNTLLSPDGYLVIARNQTNLLARYTNLNHGNTLGNFSGKLSHSGERLALARPHLLTSNSNAGVITSTIYVVEDEVTWGTGGRWGSWSAGGGSSLELIDPRSDHRLASNWGDSDETHKSAWANVEAVGLLENGLNYDPSIDYAQIGILDVGECLVDEIEVRAGVTGANLVLNPDFESGLANWQLQGCHVRSGLAAEGWKSSQSLHLRCSDRLWTGLNSCQVALATNTLGASMSATLRFKARWLRGWPEVLLRLNGNWLEATAALPVPTNLGSPGAPNSIRVGNAGPAIRQVMHTPPLPAAGQDVVVTARVQDLDGVASVVLKYRLDPDTNYFSMLMKDDGAGGDQVAGDGIYSATIPGQSSNTMAAFYVVASDSFAAASRFPSLLTDNSPVRECLVLFGDVSAGGSFGSYHLWLTQSNTARWIQLADLSNESMDGTLVSGNRIIYNMQARYAGSPYHQVFDSPIGNLCHYKWTFPEDDKFLGATSFNKLHQPGNSPGDDLSLQREQAANTLLRGLGLPWLNRRFVAVFVNGHRRGTLMEDSQCPDGDFVKEHFPNDANGFLYKMQPWVEFAPTPISYAIAFGNQSWCNLIPYHTASGIKSPARYRYNFLFRRTPDSASNYTNVYSLVDAAATYGTTNYVANLTNVADMENWMRLFAANHAAGNGDSFGAQNGQNVYGYVGTQGTRYSLLMFDFNMVFGSAYSWAPGQNLFFVNPQDTNLSNIYQQPEFRRMYWRALGELCNGPMDASQVVPLLTAKYNTFIADGLPAENPASTIAYWIAAARASIASQLSDEDATSFTANTATSISNNIAYLTGTAPFLVRSILVNGNQFPITWTGSTSWRIAVPLRAGFNTFDLVALGSGNQPLAGQTNRVVVGYGGEVLSPVGHIVINEVMSQLKPPLAQFVELYNNSTNYVFDLSGWQIPELGYTFPEGSLMGPLGFLVLTPSRPAFLTAYGPGIPVFDTFTNVLPASGGTLSLMQPRDANNYERVAGVQYSLVAPWPSVPRGQSLQLRDSTQDNWRVANWASAPPTPGAANSVLTSLDPIPPLWINEVLPENTAGILDASGSRVPWLELFNPSTNQVSLFGLALGTNLTSPALWSFPADTAIEPGAFLLLFADGLTNLSSKQELHAGFALAPETGSLALVRVSVSATQVLDFVSYSSLSPNTSFGSVPDGQSFARRQLYFPTPGATNNGTGKNLTVVINEWMASNTHTLANATDANKFDDWFELHNYGDSPANLAGYYLSDTADLPNKFPIPAGYVIPPHGFLLVWADKKTSTSTSVLHANFKLSKTGTSIGLFGPDGSAIDFVSFGAQSPDISQGRFPDGSPDLYFMSSATPGAANRVPNTPPQISGITDQALVLGQSLDLLPMVTDLDVPAQTLTFSLAEGAPLGASIDPQTGEIFWTPAGPGTNAFELQVTDNGTPPLMASVSFTVTVAPPPQLSILLAADGQILFNWDASPGQAFQLQYTDDLASGAWFTGVEPIMSTGTGMSVSISQPSTEARFFRLLVMPVSSNP